MRHHAGFEYESVCRRVMPIELDWISATLPTFVCAPTPLLRTLISVGSAFAQFNFLFPQMPPPCILSWVVRSWSLVILQPDARNLGNRAGEECLESYKARVERNAARLCMSGEAARYEHLFR